MTVGRTNDTHAEISSGLGAGVRVKLLEAGEGRTLLERAGIKVEAPAQHTSDDDYRAGTAKPGPKKGAGKENGAASAGPGVPSGPGVPASNGDGRKRQNRERDRSPSTAPSESSPR